MNVGPAEVVIILVIVFLIVVPVLVGVLFLARHRGLDDSRQAEAYPPGWQAPPIAPPPPPTGPGVAPDAEPDIEPGPPPTA